VSPKQLKPRYHVEDICLQMKLTLKDWEEKRGERSHDIIWGVARK
jgi:hypothetical protein